MSGGVAAGCRSYGCGDRIKEKEKYENGIEEEFG